MVQSELTNASPKYASDKESTQLELEYDLEWDHSGKPKVIIWEEEKDGVFDPPTSSPVRVTYISSFFF